jgi:hypothetical protein
MIDELWDKKLRKKKKLELTSFWSYSEINYPYRCLDFPLNHAKNPSPKMPTCLDEKAETFIKIQR